MPSDAILREGGSRPWLILLASDMNYYYCKAPHEMAGHPYMGANELIVAHIARLMDVPTRPIEVIEWGGHHYVGLQVLPNDRKVTGTLTPEIVARLSNREVLYRLVVMDAWMVNQDRHEGNWLGGVLGGGSAWFLANDHDQCLLAAGIHPAALAGMIDRPIDGQIIRSAAIAGAITSPFLLREAIERAESIPRADIDRVMAQIPPVWLDAPSQGLVSEFLESRAQILGDLFAGCLPLFPNLERVL